MAPQPLPTLVMKNWSAWAPQLTTPADWQQWASDPVLAQGDEPLKTAALPPMLRRRCSHLTKMALETASQVLAESTIDYAVFGSQHGELKCSVKLLQSLAEKEILSPMQFVQSVHNTASGLFSITKQLTQNTNSISAGANTFLMAMIEAQSWLAAHPKQSVLVTLFDDWLPQRYAAVSTGPNAQYAVSFIVAYSQDARGVQLQLLPGEQQEQGVLPQALVFLAWYLSGSKAPLKQAANNLGGIWQHL